MATKTKIREIRPSELMCIICRIGAAGVSDLGNERLNEIWNQIRENPREEMVLVPYDGSYFSGDVTAQNMLFHIRQDKEIMTQLTTGLRAQPTAGPGLALLRSVRDQITSPQGICGYETVTSQGWKGCPQAKSGHYEKGRAKVEQLFFDTLPELYRSQEAKEQEHIQAADEISRAKILRIFPAHLRCITCWYGGHAIKTNGEPAYNPGDMLLEVANAMRASPEIPVQLITRHCMVCLSCGGYDRVTGYCGLKGKRKTAEEMDLTAIRFLQRMGIQYTDVLPAAQLLRRFYDAYPNPGIVCSPRCHNLSANQQGRDAGLGFLDAYENPVGVIARVKKLLKLATILPDAERVFMEETLGKAQQALKSGDSKQAYQILIDRHFWNCWKFYLEKAPAALARLPKSVAKEKLQDNAEPRLLAAQRAQGRLVCDGKLNEKDWTRTKFSAGFTSILDRPALAEVGVKALYDRNNLHFGLICAEKGVKALKAEAMFGNEVLTGTKSREGKPEEAHLWRKAWYDADDSLCIFLQPDEKVPVHYSFAFNTRAMKFGERKDQGQGDSIIHDSEWEVAVHKGKQWWSAEVVIPFQALGLAGRGRKPWRVQFHHVFSRERAFIESWSSCSKEWRDLSKFGRLIFGRDKGVGRR